MYPAMFPGLYVALFTIGLYSFPDVIIWFLIADFTVCFGFLFCSSVAPWCGASSCVVGGRF
jgi:hypothetical protein